MSIGKVALILLVSHMVVYWWGRSDGRKSVQADVKGFLNTLFKSGKSDG